MDQQNPSWDTPTMAELYAQQGHLDRAVGIYRKLVAQRPDDAQARQRLAELEGKPPREGAAMSFREHMQKIVESVPGATACALMGYDGIPIDTYTVGGGALDITALLTEYSAATSSLRHVGDEQPLAGSINEVVITTSEITAILRPLNSDYFLAVVLGPKGLSGKARYIMRLAAPDLLRALS